MDPIACGTSSALESGSTLTEQMRIRYINCQSTKPSFGSVKFYEFNALVMDKFNLIAISETWLKQHISCRSVHIPDCYLIRNYRLLGRVGDVGIYISHGISLKTIFERFEHSEFGSLLIELDIGAVSVLFGVVYLPSGDIRAFENCHLELLINYSAVILIASSSI